MCPLACNVCWGITAVEARKVCGDNTAVMFSRRRLFDLTLLWIPLDLHGVLAVLSPLGSYHRLDCGILCGLYICVGHLSAVFKTSHHHLCSTEISSASLLVICSWCLVWKFQSSARVFDVPFVYHNKRCGIPSSSHSINATWPIQCLNPPNISGST